MINHHSNKIIYGLYDNSKASFFTKTNDFFINRSKVSLKEKAYFYEMLAVMIDAGIPLLKTLSILADKTSNERFKRVVNTVVYHIEQGEKFSTSLAKFPMIFSETERGIIQSGELTGSLNTVLEKLSEDISKTLDLHLKIRQAMTYPITILATLLLSLVIILGIVIPPLQNLFESVNAEFPSALSFLVHLNTFIRDYFLLLIIIIAFIIYFSLSYIKTEKGRMKWDRFKLSLPLVRDILKKSILVRFSRSLSILVDSGLPLIKTLQVTGLSLGNEVYKQALETVTMNVQHGKKISESLEQYNDLFPEDIIHIIAVGERTATIPSSSQKIAKQYEREIEHTLKNMTSIIEPIAIICVGIVVGWFAFAILGSIFSISENIG